MLAGAVQEINPELLESFAVLPGETHGGILRSTTGGGVVAGEGCALMALEKLPEAESARARAWILGYGEALNFSDQPSQASAAIVQAARGALADSRLQASEITAVFLSANGNSPWDRAEAAALRVLFGQNPPPATALKGTWGECYHAGAAMTVAAAVLCLEKNFIPPTLNLTPGCQPSSLGLSPQAQTVQARYALILSLDRDKKATALILGFPKDGAC
jgi:3-oxoacyl-(acyl-carrier-protein) synthase